EFDSDIEPEQKEMIILVQRLENGLLGLHLIDASIIELCILNSSIFDRVLRLCAYPSNDEAFLT
ncbi:hypothetical protein GJ496_007002, partial [Pomphorhynchus laevis]